jgi:hypothetical protein
MRFLKWLIGIVITVGILLAAVPLVTKWYVIRWLESKGYQAEIKRLGMNFLWGKLSAQGVALISPSGERFEIFDASADFDLWPIKDGKLVIDRLKADSARLDIRHTANGLSVAGFSFDDLMSRVGSLYPLEVRLAQLTYVDFCYATQQCIRAENVTFSRARWVTSGQNWSFVHNAPLTIEKAFLRDQNNSGTLFYGAELSIARGLYSAGSVELENLMLRNFQFIEGSFGAAGMEAPYQTQIGETSITSLQWQRGAPHTLAVGAVDVTSLRQSLYRNVDGHLMVPIRLRMPKVNLTVEKVEVRDGAVSWLDHSVTPPASANASSLHLQLGAIDNSKPDSVVSLKLTGGLYQQGKTLLEGDIYPFISPIRFALTGFVQDVDLSKLEGYSRKYLHQKVDQGLADVSISAVARNNQLEADTRWQFTDLRIEPSRGNSSDMPLELSYGLLKDHNRSVAFTMPLRGEFGSAQLEPEYIFSRQIRRVLSDMARQRVNPVGAARIPAASTSAGKVAFLPIEYRANSRYPGDADLNRLVEIAAMLRDKPHLKMTFCPVSTAGEWAEIFNDGERPATSTELLPEHEEELIGLASARGKIIRTRLIESGAAADQIEICNPTVDMSQFGLSFVSISL